MRQGRCIVTAPIPEQTFAPDWPEPDPRFLRETIPPAPPLPLVETFGPRLANWIERAAEAKSAPPDYVVAGLLAVVGSAIGNTRWVQAWSGWSEPPILWTMLIGAPSSNKSPALDAVMGPLREVERELRRDMEGDVAAWTEKAEVAKLTEAAWREAVKAAIKADETPPERPASANSGDAPFLPRFAISDSTVERLGVILANQPRGTMMLRDELAGWLQGMTRYAGGSTDRPFWLEAYGGRSYPVERMGRDPVHIERLSIGATGGIQPDRLKSLLMKSGDDDGLLARFLPIWPDPAPLRRPRDMADDGFLMAVLRRLVGLRMYTDEKDVTRPWMIRLNAPAQGRLDTLRSELRALECGSEGLILSYIGKMNGFTLRLSLILTMLDWATDGASAEPVEVTAETFDRAANFSLSYAIPMARRAYASGSASKGEAAARRLVHAIRDRAWQSFTSRDAMRLRLSGLQSAAQLNPVLQMLADGDVIRDVPQVMAETGGRPARRYAVNPAVFETK